jgi:excisionase family DNA binding protein
MARRARRAKPETLRERRWASLIKTAEYLAVSERTVRQMIYDGRLKGYRLGRTVRIDLNEVDDAMLPFGVE